MRVHVAYVAPGTELVIALDLPAGSTVDGALRASRIAERIAVDPMTTTYAIFGRRVTADTVLADGDRVDVTRPLACDPKVARRNRASGDTDSTGVRSPAGPRRRSSI